MEMEKWKNVGIYAKGNDCEEWRKEERKCRKKGLGRMQTRRIMKKEENVWEETEREKERKSKKYFKKMVRKLPK